MASNQHSDRDKLMAQALAATQSGRLDEAVSLYKQVIAAEPDYVDAYLRLSHVYMKTDNADEVITVLGEALRLDPNNTSANFGLGLAYHTKPDPERAIPYYRETLRLDPNHQEVRKYLVKALKAISHDQAELTKIAHDALAHERSGRGFMYRLVKFVTGAKGG